VYVRYCAVVALTVVDGRGIDTTEKVSAKLRPCFSGIVIDHDGFSVSVPPHLTVVRYLVSAGHRNNQQRCSGHQGRACTFSSSPQNSTGKAGVPSAGRGETYGRDSAFFNKLGEFGSRVVRVFVREVAAWAPAFLKQVFKDHESFPWKIPR
jgi:hypothetical protein